jgi:hypothetical protein
VRDYRYVVSSPEGLVKIATQLISRRCRYWFVVKGVLPPDTDRERIDRQLLEKYEVPATKDQAYQLRKRAKTDGQPRATVRYLRFEQHFLLMATEGRSVFHAERQFQDLRRVPLELFGYSLGFRNDRASVRIGDEQFRILKEHFRGIAVRYPCERLGEEINSLPFLRYAPVRDQLLQLVRVVNRTRAAWGLAPIPRDAVCLKKTALPVYE